jgi:putative membrane protein
MLPEPGFMGDWYLWLKALHIIAVMAWMAGMLYLPRLFVYHADAAPGSELSETFKIMERRLLRAIINPAMMVAWILGLALMANIAAWEDPWFHAKFLLVALLSGLHGFLSRWRKAFERDENRHSAKFFRWMNEVPTVIMIAVVILVIVRPF